MNSPDMKPIRDTEPLVSAGARWHRLDLHLHTPGVVTFSCPDGADLKSNAGRTAVVRRYVEQLAKQNITVCAITDYNGIRGEWFEPIREEAARRGIKVFPGAEVSFKTPKYGLHVLAIFPEDVSPEQINSFLQALDRDPAKSLLLPDGNHRDIELTNTTEKGALERLRDRFGCLLILPHPDGSNGLCHSFRPADAMSFLLDVRPDAIEHCPDAELRKLQNQKSVPPNFFTNLAQVEFSDPKRIEEIGTKKRQDGTPRATYIKLSASDLDALRLALHDPTTRLAVGTTPVASHARIRQMEISGSGFLGNLNVAWNDDLNVVIGGRGAGKSAIIETLRYGLGFDPYSEQSYRSDLVQHALGSGGKVSITLERPIGNDKTRKYRVVRVLGEYPRVFEVDPEKPSVISPSDLFGPTGGPSIFGQREVYAVSGSEEYRLMLLDDLIGEDAKHSAKGVQEALDSLRANARAIVEMQKRLSKREEYRQRQKTIQHEISVYEEHGVSEKLKHATAIRSDGQHLRAARESVERARRNWVESQEQIAPLASAARNLRKGQSTQKAILSDAANILENLQRNLDEICKRGVDLFRQAGEELGKLDARWTEALRPLEDELNRIKQETSAESLDPDRLIRLTEERTAIAPQIEELDRAEVELKELREKRNRIITQVRERRYEEHQLRRERVESIEKLLEGRLHLAVEFKGQKDDYKKRLMALLKGSGVSADAVEHLAAPAATDGLALAEAVTAGMTQVQDRFGITAAMADRLVKWLFDDVSRLFELETIIPADALRVDLRIDNTPRPLDRLSPGQRATAILLLLFALQGRILVLDQPEDDLDNRFVYEDIVQILREQKGLTDPTRRRQIIAATHNPNIPVIGDAELVLALDVRDGRSKIIGRASIDDREVRELVKTIMEGGEEAFRRRAEKYGGILAGDLQ